ncbi:hypothetical protein ACX8XP_16655 [Calditrichota bacterium LG25]
MIIEGMSCRKEGGTVSTVYADVHQRKIINGWPTGGMVNDLLKNPGGIK